MSVLGEYRAFHWRYRTLALLVEPKPPLTLPLRRLASGHIVVAVTFRELGPWDFLLDTGASLTALTPALASALGLPADEGKAAIVEGLVRKISDTRVVKIPELRVGGLTLLDHRAAIVDLGRVQEHLDISVAGVLGVNLFAQTTLDLDFPRGTLCFYPPGDWQARHASQVADLDASRLTLRGGLLRTWARLNGRRRIRATIDLGSETSVMNWRAARRNGVRADSPDLEYPNIALLGADGVPIRPACFEFSVLSVGEAVFPQPKLYIHGGISRWCAAMEIGLDLLSDRRVVLDVAGRTLFLSRAGSSRGPRG